MPSGQETTHTHTAILAGGKVHTSLHWNCGSMGCRSLHPTRKSASACNRRTSRVEEMPKLEPKRQKTEQEYEAELR
eukprot:SAG31_NODE_31233_length_366_cov_1.129151_1_plen_75_part_01